MKRFKELKEEILRRAHEARACREEYGRAYKAETLDDLMQVVRDNFRWCTDNNIVDGALIDAYKEEFNAGKIWHNESSITEGFMLATGSASVKAYYSASVKAYDSASVEAYDSASVEAYDSAYVYSFSIKECKLHNHAIYRIVDLNEVRYADESMKFVKVEEGGWK